VERGWLGGLRFFGALPDHAVDALTDAATELEVDLGSALVRVGDKAEHLFVVRSGRFSVRLRNGQEITQLGTREIIGELGLVDERPASADVVAMRPSVVVSIPVAAMRDALVEHPEAALSVAGIIADRLRDTSRKDRQAPRVVAIHAGDHTDALIDALATRREDAVVVGSAADAPGAELNHTVLFGTERLGAAADLTISTSSSTAGLGIWVDDVGPPAGLCIGVDPGDPASLDRLARFIFGGARVLVLGGGGFRALATMGLLLEFADAGLDFDAFAGVSACSPSTVLLAAGLPVEEVVDRSLAFGRAVSLGRDLGFTTTAISTGKSLTEACRQVCGDLELHRLAYPALLGTTRLSDRQSVPLVDGPAWRAVRASASLPVVFPPVAIGGSLYVDGGVADNMPTHFAYERFPEAHVTGVSVGSSSTHDLSEADSDGVAKRQLRGGGARILDVIVNCLRGDDQHVRADEMISLNFTDAGLLAATDFDEGIAFGRRAAKNYLLSQNERAL